MSSENYEQLQGKMVCQEEQITEYTEKLAILEEELKRVTELFSENKMELEECNTVQCKSQELEETQKNLQESKLQLAQEEFVTSALHTTEKKLHLTANKLLSTVTETTKDVSGLHAKLDRKAAVEQHNAQVQGNFAEEIDKMFCRMLESFEEYSAMQKGKLDEYAGSINDLLGASCSALGATVAAVSTSINTVQDTVSRQVGQSMDGISKLEGLSAEAKAEMQKHLDERQFALQKALASDLLPIVTSVLDLFSQMSRCMPIFLALADEVDSHKAEMDGLFTEHSMMLHKLRRDATSALSTIQVESKSLKEELQTARTLHSQGLINLLSLLQNQMNLFAVETDQSF